MKKIIMEGPKKSRIVHVDIPKINDSQLLVKVVYTGMCHSEWYPWSVAAPGDSYGHETVGIVADKGRAVKGFQIGDRVTGLGGGGYQEYIVMEPEKAFVVPDAVETIDAIVEPIGCMMSVGERMMSPKIGDTIAVVGTGYMGLGMVSLFKAMGYANIIAVDEREIALENAKKYGATEGYLPSQLPESFVLNWDTWGDPDLKRNGHTTDIFNIGFQSVVEFTGTQSGLQLASEMVCAHGTLGIAGFHNDGLRTLDMKLANMKAITMHNCHERRIAYEFTMCRRGMQLIAQNQWNMRGLVNRVYSMEEFDKAQMDMVNHTDNFIKGAVKCDA